NAIREISGRLARTRGLTVEVYGQGEGRWFRQHKMEPGLVLVDAPRLVSRSGGNALLALMCCLYALVVRRPDVILLFASGPSLLAVIARLFRVRVIAALRAIDSQRDKWGPVSAMVLRLGEFSALHVAHACTVNSLEMFRHYDGETWGLHYIPNGATDCQSGSDEVLDRFGLRKDGYLLFAARFDPVKRLHLLLQAYGRLPEAGRLPLVVAGGNCKSPAYQRQLEELAGPGVIFVGHVTREILDPLTRNCAVFVLPSILEGMSNSLLAAMRSGRCVLCADVDANRDVVLGDESALFAADDVDELARKLAEYCASPEQREACGRKMMALVDEHYCWDMTAASYLQLITRTLGTEPHQALS